MTNRVATIATIFSGFEGVGLGARAAGLHHLWGVEIEDELAQVARANGFHTITADATRVDYGALPRVDVLHASPPCTTASNANVGATETELDLLLGAAVEWAIIYQQPKIFTLENVWGYRGYWSFRSIVATLRVYGYAVDWWHLNAADYGVPQTRKRLILVARRDGVRPVKPRPTHHKPQPEDEHQMALLPRPTRPWVGWYEAVEDIIDTFPASKLAKWQRERLKKQGVSVSTIVDGANAGRPITVRELDEPVMTLTSGDGHKIPLRAMLVSGQPNNYGTTLSVRDGGRPAPTVGASYSNQKDTRLLVSNSTGPDAWGDGTREGEDPAPSISTQAGGRMRLMMTGAARIINSNGAMSINDGADRVGTIVANYSHRLLHAQLGPRVVRVTPSSAAAFQSFPRDYRLPERATLAWKGIGNSVPPLLYQRVIEAQGVGE